MIRTRNEAERDADYSGLSNAELLAKFDDMTELDDRDVVRPRSHQLRAGLGREAQRLLRRGDAARTIPTESYQILQGYHTRPVDAAHGLWGLSRVVRDSPTLHQLFDENHPRDLASEAGARPRRAGRSSSSSTSTCSTSDGAATPSTTSPTCRGGRTRRSRSGNIARYINMPDEDDPMIQYERAVKHREDLTAKIRAKLADDPEQLAKFDELYDAAAVCGAAHRGPRVLHRPDGRRAAAHVRARRRRRARPRRRDRRSQRRVLPLPATRSATRCRTAATNARRSPSAGPRSRPPHRRRRQVRSARRPRRRRPAASSTRSWTPSSPACSASSRRPRAKSTPT